jgi:DNA polymerase-3 subunit gamma/tau
VARERLLELIDLCAAGEQKMKWAANKRMYLEVTLLRAIQTVGQVTLGEVLEALKALKGGGAVPERLKAERPAKVRLPVSTPQAMPVVASVQVASKSPAPSEPACAGPKVEDADTISLPASAAPEAEAGSLPGSEFEMPVSAPEAFSAAPTGDVSAELKDVAPRLPEANPSSFALDPVLKSASLPLEEIVSDEKPSPGPVSVPNYAPASEQTPAPKVSAKVFAVETLWPILVERVRKERSFISMWVESGVLDEIREGVAVFVFAEEQSLAADYISKDGHREFLEEILLELTGAPLKVRTELRESVQRRPVAQPPPPVKAAAKDPMEEFKNDPLIRKALEIFKARLEAVH